jgi:hypothetical protein
VNPSTHPHTNLRMTIKATFLSFSISILILRCGFAYPVQCTLLGCLRRVRVVGLTERVSKLRLWKLCTFIFPLVLLVSLSATRSTPFPSRSDPSFFRYAQRRGKVRYYVSLARYHHIFLRSLPRDRDARQHYTPELQRLTS